MRVAVDFQDERVDLDIPEGSLVVAWHGPAGLAPAEVPARVDAALENPRGYPPLRQAVVPGDRVVIALGPDVPEAPAVLGAVCGVLERAGVDAGAVTVLADPDAPDVAPPRGVTVRRHDPDDRTQLAYLATTSEGRRVYLSRDLTDADLVVPVGRLAYDPVLGYRGPWGVIFPGLSDTETRRAFRARAGDDPPDLARPRPPLRESTEVSWLLGCQLQLGVVAGASGMLDAVAGLSAAVLDHGAREVDGAWTVRAGSRAEVVVVGIGRPDEPTRIGDVAQGLATATRLVRRGGKIVALSRAGGPIGPAMQRLVGADEPGRALAALRGHESDPDYPAARQLAQALAWADVYLLSALGQDAVEDLAMIPLDRPEEARRLAAVSGSCLVVSQADLARATVDDEPD